MYFITGKIERSRDDKKNPNMKIKKNWWYTYLNRTYRK